MYGRYRRFNKNVRRLHSEAGLELVIDNKSEHTFECEGSTIFSPCESDGRSVNRLRFMETRQMQEMGDEDFIQQLGGGIVKVADCDGEVHELAAVRSRAASFKAR